MSYQEPRVERKTTTRDATGRVVALPGTMTLRELLEHEGLKGEALVREEARAWSAVGKHNRAEHLLRSISHAARANLEAPVIDGTCTDITDVEEMRARALAILDQCAEQDARWARLGF